MTIVIIAFSGLPGPHAKAWTRQPAADYLAANTALSLHFIGTEVDRYIVWPGQALAYKIGELTIWDLRARAEQTLGDAFDIREFHDSVLTEGGLPLHVSSGRNFLRKSYPDIPNRAFSTQLADMELSPDLPCKLQRCWRTRT